jgi:hypothetical protein
MLNRAYFIKGSLLSVFSLGALLPTGLALLRRHPESPGVALWNGLGLFPLLAALALPTEHLSAFNETLADGLFGLFVVCWVSALAKAVTDRQRPNELQRD